MTSTTPLMGDSYDLGDDMDVAYDGEFVWIEDGCGESVGLSDEQLGNLIEYLRVRGHLRRLGLALHEIPKDELF